MTSSTYSSKPFSPVTAQVAGETGAALWNNRGTNGCAPTALQFGAYATTSQFYHAFSFRSATGAPQPGLIVTLSPSAKQATVRMSWLQLKDNGSTGIDLLFYDLAPSASSAGQFVAATTIATGLSYTDTHDVSMTIDFVDGVTNNGGLISGNDVVKVYLNGSLIHTGSTWESYYYFSEQIVAGTPRKQAVNAMLYNVSGTAAPATAGNGFHFIASTTDNAPPTPPNTAPVANDDGYATSEDVQLVVGAPGVLGNDTDADDDALTATLVSGTSNGTLVLNSDGSFSYTPNPDFSGTDSFTYMANDGTEDSAVATATITVSSVPDIAVTGFFSPVDMGLVNVAKAGQTVPLKFRLTDESGAGLQVPGFVFSGNIVQSGSTTGGDEIEQYVSGASGLQYLGDGYYQWNLQTSKAWANTSRALTASFTAPGYAFDNAQLVVQFRFKK